MHSRLALVFGTQYVCLFYVMFVCFVCFVCGCLCGFFFFGKLIEQVVGSSAEKGTQYVCLFYLHVLFVFLLLFFGF